MDKLEVNRTNNSNVSFDVFALEKKKKYSLIREIDYHFIRINDVPTSSRIKGIKKSINKTGIKMNESKIINRYMRTMENAGFDLSMLYTQFKNTAIDFRTSGLTGTYDLENNTLLVDSEDVTNSLIRALFDMTMTRKYPNFVTRGFESVSVCTSPSGKNITSHIGFGLYEAYKELILKRLFDIPVRSTEMYDLVRLIEIAVGEKRMKQLFEQGAIGNFAKKMNIKTIYLMDILYQRICKRGKIGIQKTTRLFSHALREFTKDAVAQLKRDADDAIVLKWDSVDGEWQRTIYEDDLDRAKQELREVREIVSYYQRQEAFKVKLANEDSAYVEMLLDNARIQDSSYLIGIAGPVKRLRGTSRRR